ncbi:glutathione S-transferase [Chloropicon primus]|nr:glutathione S-transferase [Chloropicon primus]
MIAGGSVKVPAARVGSQGIAGRRGVSVRARASAVRAAVERPPKVVLDELPIVYAYDHCPYCVRVRLGLGLKNVKHEVVFMANDDVKKPTGLIGKKIAPIFEIPDEKLIMGESMDIVKKIDAEEKYGSTGFFAGATDRKDIKAWMKSPEWKAEEFGQEAREEAYAAAMAKTPELLPELNAALVELEKLIYSDSSCSEVGLGLDDIDLWSRLRSVTLVEGAEFQPKTLAYLNNLSEAGDVPLYFGMKC